MGTNPFVGVRSQSDRNVNLSDITSSLIENTFLQNQLLRRAPSVSGTVLTAAGTAMAISGDRPKTSYRSHLQARDTTGKKAFKPYTYRGRTYDRPLGKRGFYFRGGTEHGYNTDRRNKSGVKKRSPGKSKTGRAISGTGRAVTKFAAPIGLGLVAYNIHRHGVKETAKAEGKFWAHDIPLGAMGGVNYLDNQVLGGSLADASRESSIIQTMLLSAALGAVF